eukprot:3728803-Rhodomonas_salina.2
MPTAQSLAGVAKLECSRPCQGGAFKFGSRQPTHRALLGGAPDTECEMQSLCGCDLTSYR